jgi:solute carrier family 50 protein (sugar transporter)
MAGFTDHLVLAFGLLGNLISFMVFLAPLPTFYKIYKKKSTEGFQSIPYVVGLFSAMLWIYYALLKSNAMLLITINSVGCFVMTFYTCFFLYYAPKKIKIETAKVVVLMNVVGFGLIIVLSQFLATGIMRVRIVGWICLIFSLCVFVAPLGIVRQVIRTKSVEYMPFLLSFFLTLSAIMWFFYGLLLKDFNIAIPNVLGFTFGILQMILYVMYKNAKKVNIDEKLPQYHDDIIKIVTEKTPEQKEQVMDVVKLNNFVSEMIPVVSKLNNNNCGDEAHNVAVIPSIPVVQAV